MTQASRLVMVIAAAAFAVGLLAAPPSLSAEGAATISVVAAGMVDPDGTVQQGFNVGTVRFHNNSFWIVRLKGPAQDFFTYKYVAIATPIGGVHTVTASTGGIDGKLYVILKDTKTQAFVKWGFSFVVYKITTTAAAE